MSTCKSHSPSRRVAIPPRTRWAILGTGKIARRFATSLRNLSERAELLAIGSRRQESAEAFGEQYHVPRRYAGYECVAADPQVDIVFIGTPTVYHQRDMRMCLEAGKAVLCEKAFTINAQEAGEVIRLAREKKLFLMEAMWTHFFPVHVKLRQLIAAGAIGAIRGMLVSFTATVPSEMSNRFFDLHLGAGVLLDTGSYGISFAHKLLGEPDAVTGLAYFGESGADYSSAYVLRFQGGQLASITCSQVAAEVKDAVVFGTGGKIEIHAPWYKPERMTLHMEGKKSETFEYPLGSYQGYEYEAEAVMDCLERGETECSIMPLEETLAVMKIMDGLRAQWGFKYPFE